MEKGSSIISLSVLLGCLNIREKKRYRYNILCCLYLGVYVYWNCVFSNFIRFGFSLSWLGLEVEKQSRTGHQHIQSTHNKNPTISSAATAGVVIETFCMKFFQFPSSPTRFLSLALPHCELTTVMI